MTKAKDNQSNNTARRRITTVRENEIRRLGLKRKGHSNRSKIHMDQCVSKHPPRLPRYYDSSEYEWVEYSLCKHQYVMLWELLW